MCIYTLPGPVTGLGYLHVTELDKQKDIYIYIDKHSQVRSQGQDTYKTKYKQVDRSIYIYNYTHTPRSGHRIRIQLDRQIGRQTERQIDSCIIYIYINVNTFPVPVTGFEYLHNQIRTYMKNVYIHSQVRSQDQDTCIIGRQKERERDMYI